MKKYYEEAKYNAAFDRCMDVMSRLLIKYGNQALERMEQNASQTAECLQENGATQPLIDKAA